MPLPSFLLPWFAIAGLAAAVGPLLIHLLNRRRYRIVEWAAMDFLREAISASRRAIQLRDILLLLLRMACVVLFGAALARPFFTRSDATAINPDQPVHCVLLIDNSLSMSYQKLDGVLLDDAKAKAREVIEQLPRGSRISVLPTCGSARALHYEPYSSVEDARDALAAIQPVDRATRPVATIDLAQEACRRVPAMSAKRIVLVTDQQVASWSPESLAANLKQLPCSIEVIQVTPDLIDNAWIADFKLRDGVADLQTPATLVAMVGYQGPAPRHDVQVTLSIDGAAVASQTVDLMPGQVREVQFPPYKFDVPVEPGKPTFVTAEVSIPHDRLPADDHRFLVVPVVAALPVVFVDSAGSEEDPRNNLYGETFFLRRLLAPLTHRDEQERQLVQVRHLKPEQVSQETLADARLVVLAGLNSPRGLVSVLQEYVEQGGNLVIAAGGQFDPAAWNDEAWSDGLGILPAPLRPLPVGHLPDETTGALEPLLLDFDTLVHEYFLPEGTPEEELKGMYGPPVMFFKAVAAEASDEMSEKTAAAVRRHFDEKLRGVADLDRKLAELAKREASQPSATPSPERAELERQRSLLRPNWLLWRNVSDCESQRTPEELAQKAKPHVLGKFTGGLPFIVRRQWGEGNVLLISTGVAPGWNTMPVARQAVWVYDRMLRSLLLSTFPARNLTSEEPLALPVAPAERAARFTLTDPASQEQSLSVDALGGDRYGIAWGNWTRRGIYHVVASRSQDPRDGAADARLWEIPVAVNGPAEESELSLPENDPRAKPQPVATLAAVGGAGATLVDLQSTDLWKWCLAAVLLGLLVELAALARISRNAERPA